MPALRVVAHSHQCGALDAEEKTMRHDLTDLVARVGRHLRDTLRTEITRHRKD